MFRFSFHTHFISKGRLHLNLKDLDGVKLHKQKYFQTQDFLRRLLIAVPGNLSRTIFS